MSLMTAKRMTWKDCATRWNLKTLLSNVLKVLNSNGKYFSIESGNCIGNVITVKDIQENHQIVVPLTY